MKLLLFLICLLSITSCNLEDKDRYFYLNADLKAFFNYNKGSFWIYHDDAIDETDTLVITSYQHYIGEGHSDSYIDHQETLNISYSTSNSRATIEDRIYATNLDCTGALRDYEIKTAADTFYRREISLSSNSKFIDSSPNHAILEDYTVNGTKYANVLHYTDEFCINKHRNEKTDTVKVEYFIAKTVGVIEKRYSSPTETQCWKLVAYHLEY